MSSTVTFHVNGEDRTVDVAAGDILLDVVRTDLGVKSPKIGCERGDCGSCTVLFDGKTVRSCLILAVEADGHAVTTLEGLEDGHLTDLQETLIARSSFQCGFCAPGIVLATTELLEHEPHPDREQVQEAISGNLCRCTGYQSIVDAILETSGVDDLLSTRSGSP